MNKPASMRVVIAGAVIVEVAFGILFPAGEISATGSVAMGRVAGEVVAHRLGRSLLELGGNNGLLVMDDADLDLALRAVLFAAVGTAGQRCTTTRRLFLQRGIAAEMKPGGILLPE